VFVPDSGNFTGLCTKAKVWSLMMYTCPSFYVLCGWS